MPATEATLKVILVIVVIVAVLGVIVLGIVSNNYCSLSLLCRINDTSQCPSSITTRVASAPARARVGVLVCHNPQEQQYREVLLQMGAAELVPLPQASAVTPASLFASGDANGVDALIIDTNLVSQLPHWRAAFPQKLLFGGVHAPLDNADQLWQKIESADLDAVIVKRPVDGQLFNHTPVIMCPYVYNNFRNRILRERPIHSTNPYRITVLIGQYRERFPIGWNRFNRLKALLRTSKWEFDVYDPSTERSTSDDIGVLLQSGFLLNFKEGGYLCNAVGRALATGTPVLMDRLSLDEARFPIEDVVDGKTALIVDTPEQLAARLSTLTLDECNTLREACWEATTHLREHDVYTFRKREDMRKIKNLFDFSCAGNDGY